MENKPKLRTYRKMKTELKKERYLLIEDRKTRRQITKMRIGTNDLRIETGRWKGEEVSERRCLMCMQGSIEDEEHFMLHCTAYRGNRDKMFNIVSVQL